MRVYIHVIVSVPQRWFLHGFDVGPSDLVVGYIEGFSGSVDLFFLLLYLLNFSEVGGTFSTGEPDVIDLNLLATGELG